MQINLVLPGPDGNQVTDQVSISDYVNILIDQQQEQDVRTNSFFLFILLL
jgi:hypothetical protein